MKRVQLAAVGWAGAGLALVLLLGLLDVEWWMTPLPPVGWAAAAAYLLVSNTLLVRGLQRRRSERFGPANIVTSMRSTLVGLITGLVVASLFGAVPVALLVGLVIPALALDAVDGWVARRTGTTSELGARFDMEVDAFLLLVLSVHVASLLGLWVLAIGGLRYAFVAAGWALPWLRARLPYRYWRKVVTAYAGIALAAACTGALPAVSAVLVAVALLLLLESFGRDVVWLVRERERVRDAVREPLRVED
ncbi:CDP-alcohol phosphatidyltransferase family protein [Leifsonia shinshuensis]|uniref:Phosphatidylglycerophosphate synthase n=1 Tax=Leifsonia shinshuensis TaxID=150026 RepID=A0A853CZT2_9MICO|nr:phosphatidylglycerophosphate synthase [Leifsonia shinshuensis]